ncbi:hypothetical protein I4641_13785 [Waterburya agarophytonicola K14]|uniref:Uncharacterized protein n=1 Tax=Waterburya agarophytonicola KI4 TaxID=2874699 RepID=A0A964BTN8_9CYAN|nr:hypothetical protein [Waterburya agarophytonicola]MCC0178051.1 hypothetical protein [Waterburya agarophytonicola KI4]
MYILPPHHRAILLPALRTHLQLYQNPKSETFSASDFSRSLDVAGGLRSLQIPKTYLDQ